jgi:SAM-dependent methyltransferase
MLREQIASQLIRLSQRTVFRGTGGYAARSAGPGNFPQAETELAHLDDFFGFFSDAAAVRSALDRRRVLDFGCGYGGRTVGYATRCGAATVTGVEPFEHMVVQCRAFAEQRGASNCRFLANTQHTLPMPDEEVDVAVSYDVFEHVSDPIAMLSELRRVLSPGGTLYIVFTPYFGAFSHHLNYITQLPGLHWIFDPETLVNAVNVELRNGGTLRFGTNPQPAPHLSPNGRRRALPTVNGLTGIEFIALARQYFRVLDVRSTPLLKRFRVLGSVGERLNALINRLDPRVEEALSFNLVLTLEK